MKKYFFAAIVLFLFVYSYENDLLQNVTNKLTKYQRMLRQVQKADELPKEKTDQEKKADGIVKAKKFLMLKEGTGYYDIFKDRDLSWINLPKANLERHYLVHANLANANLSGANLNVANLSGANLSRADLSGALLRAVDLRGADLSGADLSGADLSHAALKYKVNLTGANLTGANLTGAKLQGADMTGADLTEANLTEVVVGGAIFCNTKTPWGLDNSGCK
jgi:hypothetical protein